MERVKRPVPLIKDFPCILESSHFIILSLKLTAQSQVGLVLINNNRKRNTMHSSKQKQSPISPTSPPPPARQCKIHRGPCCHSNWHYSLLSIINGGLCYYSILEISLSPVLHCRMQYHFPIHKYFITTVCCVSSSLITLRLIHPLLNSCRPVGRATFISSFHFCSLHFSCSVFSCCKTVIVG